LKMGLEHAFNSTMNVIFINRLNLALFMLDLFLFNKFSSFQFTK
jgi:hypothetical protein